jgi:hypothetical protein
MLFRMSILLAKALRFKRARRRPILEEGTAPARGDRQRGRHGNQESPAR